MAYFMLYRQDHRYKNFRIEKNWVIWYDSDIGGENMYPGIENILYQHGYQRISLNISGIALFLRQKQEIGTVVVTIDETTGLYLSREQFEHISETFRDFLRKRECYSAVFLYLLISEDDSSARRLFEDYENYWRIIPSENKLMVYEAGDGQFDELRPALERQFPGRRSFREQEAYAKQAPYGQQAMYGQRAGGFLRNYAPAAFGKFPVVNAGIIIMNVIIFFGVDLFFFQDDRAAEWGALNWYRVREYGEWYRLLSSMFLHEGIQHIFNNMLVLMYIGSCVEQQIGKIRYGILYLGSGILAGFTSMVYNMTLDNQVYSLGASGAVFGVMGALLFLVLFRNKYAGGYNVRQIVVMVMFSLYGGFASQGVDNAAHIGGFIAGFLLAAGLSIGRLPGVNRKFGGNR